jgi:hypothetical protein
MTTYNVPAPTGVAATDLANINSSLNSANGDPGSTVVLAAGTYLINGRIRIGSNTEFKGQGSSSSTIKVANYAIGTNSSDCIFPPGTPVISIISGYATDISIHDFEFDGNCVNQSSTLGDASYSYHGNTSSAGNSVEVMAIFAGSSDGHYVTNISIYNMHIHDCFSEALMCRYGQNIKVYNCNIENMMHDAIYYVACKGSGNEIHNNTIQAITDGGIRLDSCQDVKVYKNIITPYTGTNNVLADNTVIFNGGENGMQIANNGSYTQLTNNIEVYDNTFTDIDLCGIWLNDAKNTAKTTAMGVHIYNNEFTNCGKRGNSNVTYCGAIGFNKWGNGVVIEYNKFDGSHPIAILILAATTASSTLSIKINNNNIINTEGKGPSGSAVAAAAVGYGIYNAVNTKVSAIITGNYFSNNLTGNCYLCTSTGDASSPNGVAPGTGGSTGDGGATGGGSTGGSTGGGSTGGGIVIPVGPYIPRSQVVRQSLSDYFRTNYHVETNYGYPVDGYLNQYPIRLAQFTPSTQKTIASNKAPGMDARNLGNFGYSGSDLTLMFTVYSIEEAWELLAAADARIPAILEPYCDDSGNYLDGWYISGIPSTDTATINPRQGDELDNSFDIRMSFLADTPFYKRTLERIRTRRVFENMQKWSSADSATGNLLKNSDFNSWSTGESNVAPDWWTLESTGQLMSEYTVDDAGFSIQINGDGTTENLGSISQPVYCDEGETYIIVAEVAATGVTQGQIQVEYVANGAIVNQIVLSADSEYVEKAMYVMNTQAITDALVRVHVTGTANSEASFFCDKVLLMKASDVELQEAGTDIITLGKYATVPDLEVSAVSSSTTSVTQDVAGTQVTLINGTEATTDDVNTYSTLATDYANATSLQVTVTLPALSNGGKYRIDNVAAQIAIANVSYYAWMEVLVSSTSLGEDVKIAEWSANSLYTSSYTSESTDISNVVSANESVTLKFKLKTTSASYRAYAKRLTVKYTPITPSSGYGDIAGTQVLTTYTGTSGIEDAVYSSAQTAYNTDGKEAEIVLTPPTGAKIRMDGLSFYLAIANTSYYSWMKVTVQSATTYPTETLLMERSSQHATSSYELKSSVITNIEGIVNEALTLRFYLKTTNSGSRAYAKRMTYKYTPLYPQAPPDPVSGENSVSIWNDADPTTSIELARNLLPCCKVVQNHDRTGSFECNLHFNDNTYLIVCSNHTGDTYSSTDRALTLEANTGALTFIFDTQCPVTGIPWLSLSLLSGNIAVQISKDGSTWYDVDSNDATVYTQLTPVYRELQNLANCKLKGENKIYIKVSAGSSGCVMNYLKIYADTINLDGVYPKIFPGGANTFGAVLIGNPVDITIRSRDANRAI